MTNFGSGTISMEEIRKFPLPKNKFRLWEQFITDNFETIYSNKDIHEVYHTPNSPVYIISVFRNEQSGMQEFLEKLIKT